MFCLLGPLGVCPNLSDLQGIPMTNIGTTQSDDPKQTGGTPPDPQLNLSNLLNQSKVTKTGTGAESGKEAMGGVYVGAGLSPVSYKLAQRILQWEYIDMAELLPEVQLFGGAEDGRSGNRRTTVVDKLQCFGIYVSVLAPSYPESIPELIAYMLEIVGQAKRFRGKTWVLYDATFRRQAAASGNCRWSEVNSTLHESCYSGEAPSGLGCELCMSSAHSTRECALRGRDNGTTSPGPPTAGYNRPGWWQLPPSGEVCKSWNENRCWYPMCRHTHVCHLCGKSPSHILPMGSVNPGTTTGA